MDAAQTFLPRERNQTQCSPCAEFCRRQIQQPVQRARGGPPGVAEGLGCDCPGSQGTPQPDGYVLHLDGDCGYMAGRVSECIQVHAYNGSISRHVNCTSAHVV